MRRVTGCLLSAAIFAGAGCVPPKRVERPPYYGPTLDLPSLVEKINSTNGRLKTLRAEGTFSPDLVDPRTKEHIRNGGDLVLLYRPNLDFRLVGKVLGRRVFDIGSNASDYWMLLSEQKELYHGTHAGDASNSPLPIRPELLPQVLGVTPLDDDLLAQPSPVLRFDHDADAYVLTWHVRMRDRFAVLKEVRYDRQTLRPGTILLYDANGRVVLRAKLSEPKPIEGYNPPLAIATRYDLFFPDTGSTFDLRLKEMERDRDGVPGDENFEYPADQPGDVRKVELDR